MKKYIPYLVIFLIGALAGMWAHRQYNRTHTELVVQADTIVRFDTIKYSKLELIGKNYRLDLPKIDNPRMVLIPADSTTIIYRDSVRYVTLPRQFYFTETKDAQIWHSGIDSTIDSLIVYKSNMVISKTETTTLTPSPWRYSLSIGADYERINHVFLSPHIGAEIGYKKISLGIEGGVSIGIENSVIQEPRLYWKMGVKYNLLGR